MATKVPVLGNIGAEVNLLIKQGSTFGPNSVVLKNPDGSFVNLTGAVIRGQIRKKALDTAVVCTFDVVVTDAVNGAFTFGLTDETTATIVADEVLLKPGSLYYWDMELQDSVGRIIPLYYGEVRVFREVTRD